MPYTFTDKCIGCSLCKKVCPTDAIIGKPSGYHKVQPELCIDCGACGRVCPQAAVLDPKGKVCLRIRFKSRWPRPVISKDSCVSCVVCIDACPVDCLALSFTRDTSDRRGYPVLQDARRCIACEFCALECPVDAIAMAAPEA